MDIASLRQERANKHNQLTALQAKWKGENRTATETEQSEFDHLAASIESLDTQIATAEAADRHRNAGTIGRADASAIAKLCIDGGVPNMVAALLAEGVTVATAQERIGAASKIGELVTSARKKDKSIPEDQAAKYLADGLTVEQVRAALFDRIVASEEATSVSSHVGVGDKSGRDIAKASMARILGKTAA